MVRPQQGWNHGASGKFTVFSIASEVSKEAKASVLVNIVGPAGYEVLSTFIFEDGENDEDNICLLKKFDATTMSMYKIFTLTKKTARTLMIIYVTYVIK